MLDPAPKQSGRITVSEMKICKIEGCGKPSRKRKMCAMHYTRWRVHGDPNFTKIQVFPKGEPIRWLQAHVAYDGEDCLKWPFAKRGSGYGSVSPNGRGSIGAHRYMCILVHGEPFDPKWEARHLCGKGDEGCVNPKHIVWGTRQQNVEDRRTHGTNPIGERSGKTRFTSDEVEFIRSLKGQMMYKDIAALFDVDASCISRIMSRKRWI